MRVYEILTNVADIVERKNKDYGDSFSRTRRKYGEVIFLARLEDKFNRLETLVESERAVADETVIDTLRDIIGYCALELCFREEELDADAGDDLDPFEGMEPEC